MDYSAFRYAQRLQSLFPPGLSEMLRLAGKLERLYGGEPEKATPAKPKWDVRSDPHVPEKFKSIYPDKLSFVQRDPKAKQFWTSLLLGRAKALTDSNREKHFYNLTLNTLFQYLRLAEAHFFSREPGPVSKGELWQAVTETHRLYCSWLYGKPCSGAKPTHPERVFKNLGLESLPPRPAGRPPGNW